MQRSGKDHIMTRRTKYALTIGGVAVPAFLLFPLIFTPSEEMQPTPGQIPFFMVLGAVEALLLGAGVAFVIFARKYVREVDPTHRMHAWAAYLTLAWLMLQWYPHGGLHVANGPNMQGILLIDYGFHLPLFISPLILLWAGVGLLRARNARHVAAA